MRNWLKEERNKKSFTLKQMGEALGICESYYKRIEDGNRQKKMDIQMVSKISAVTGMPINVIIAYEQNI